MGRNAHSALPPDAGVRRREKRRADLRPTAPRTNHVWSILAVVLAFSGPAFPQAPGWDTAQMHGVPPDAPAAMTATVPLAERPNEMPHATLASLGADDVLIQVLDYGEKDLGYPARPVRLGDGVRQTNWEGGEGLRYVITARIDGRSIEADVYLGAGANLRTADQRLAQLIL
jgi:hypothetical protein